MKNNNAIFAAGAYRWVLSETEKYGLNEPITVSMEDTIRSIESGGHDVIISIFEPQTDKDKSDVILMLEWVEYQKERINLYPLEKSAYETIKKQYPGYIAIFKMNGRIRYMQQINAGSASLPSFYVDM